MPFGAEALGLSEEERRELRQMTQSRTLPTGDVLRARMILLLADGVSYQKIQELLDTTAPTISRWNKRFLQHRIAGLIEERHPGQSAFGEDAKAAGQGAGRDQRGPERWFHALVVPETAQPLPRQQRHDSTDLGAS